MSFWPKLHTIWPFPDGRIVPFMAVTELVVSIPVEGPVWVRRTALPPGLSWMWIAKHLFQREYITLEVGDSDHITAQKYWQVRHCHTGITSYAPTVPWLYDSICTHHDGNRRDCGQVLLLQRPSINKTSKSCCYTFQLSRQRWKRSKPLS